MKRLVYLILCLMLISSALNAKGWKTDRLKDGTTGSRTFTGAAGTTLYSEVFDSAPDMALEYTTYDTLALDSINVTFKLQSEMGKDLGTQQWKDEWTSTVVTADSTTDRQLIGTSISPTRKYRVAAVLNSGTTIDSNIFLKIRIKRYEY